MQCSAASVKQCHVTCMHACSHTFAHTYTHTTMLKKPMAAKPRPVHPAAPTAFCRDRFSASLEASLEEPPSSQSSTRSQPESFSFRSGTKIFGLYQAHSKRDENLQHLYLHGIYLQHVKSVFWSIMPSGNPDNHFIVSETSNSKPWCNSKQNWLVHRDRVHLRYAKRY